MDKHTAPPSGRSPTIAPLARDLDGRSIRLPDGVVGWRVRRHTGGRPRLVLGESKQPMQFPLEYTLVDVEEILPPGTYRLDAIDEEGNSAGVTVPITIPGPRNAEARLVEDEGDDERAAGAVAAVLPASGSDVRLVLEANVRATQMAFVHNERTLAVGMRMAETLREGVQSLTEAQSDWIKAMATTRGFFRNAPPLQVAAPVARPSNREKEDDEDEDEDEDDEDDGGEAPEAPGAPVGWMATLVPAIAPLVQELAPMFTDMIKGARASGAKLDVRDFLYWGRSKKTKARAAAADGARESVAEANEADRRSEPAPAAAGREHGAERPPRSQRKQASHAELLAMLPPELLPKLLVVRTRLTADEQEQLMELLGHMPPEDLSAVAAELTKMSPDDIVAFVRKHLEKPTPATATATAPAPGAE